MNDVLEGYGHHKYNNLPFFEYHHLLDNEKQA